jgi:hypothetical protein
MTWHDTTIQYDTIRYSIIHTDMHAYRYTDRQTGRQTGIGMQADRKTYSQPDRHTDISDTSTCIHACIHSLVHSVVHSFTYASIRYTTLHDTARCDTTRYDMTWHDILFHYAFDYNSLRFTPCHCVALQCLRTWMLSRASWTCAITPSDFSSCFDWIEPTLIYFSVYASVFWMFLVLNIYRM